MADLSDDDLLSRHAGGDPDAFGELFRRHQDRLWTVAVHTCGDPRLAAAAVHEAVLTAYRRIGSARDLRGLQSDTPATWLQQIVVDACLDRLRRERPVGTTGVTDVEGAFAALPDQQRSAMALVDLGGLPLREAATILRVPEATVSSRLRRGRDALLTRLRPLQGT